MLCAKKILKKLQGTNNVTFRLIVRWMLLAFIAVTLLVALVKVFKKSSPITGISLYEQLEPLSNNQQMILLFHYAERCTQCLNMEKFTGEVLNEEFPEMIADKKVQFKLVTMDSPAYLNLVERFHLFSATIVLVQFENMKEKRVIVLNDLWKDSQNEAIFKRKIREELHQFLSSNE